MTIVSKSWMKMETVNYRSPVKLLVIDLKRERIFRYLDHRLDDVATCSTMNQLAALTNTLEAYRLYGKAGVKSNE